MKFQIVTDYQFDWPVEMKVPDPKRPGAKVTQQFIGKFRYLTRSESLDRQERFKALTTDEERDQHRVDLIREVLIGWDEGDVVDDEGRPMPFSAEALEGALELHWFREGVYRAYEKALVSEGARRGN